MPKKRTVVLALIILALVIIVPIMATVNAQNAKSEEIDSTMSRINMWQIDGFEGGKGSRKAFLEKCATKCFIDENVYLNVVTLTAEAARENVAMGNLPDIISYPSLFYGIENLINNTDFVNKIWCNGSYFLLTLEGNFDDFTPQNTVINNGKDNLANVAAIFCRLNGAAREQPSNAYTKLISGKYKYLLGTQRDVFRLKTRGVSFKVKQLNSYNDLYQNVSIITKDSYNYQLCSRFVSYLCSENCDVSSLGVFSEYCKNLGDDVSFDYTAEYEYRAFGPCGKSYVDELNSAAQNNNIDKLKSLLK
ncbi:MAG: hypothetical protein K2N47_05565 [Clostridia bacterium]|nr:hypothetical protein [Clostridia bacterium]